MVFVSYITSRENRRTMANQNFLDELNRRIAKYDLLKHPFYQAWAMGELTREDLRHYAANYYHHVDAFPAYLAKFAGRLSDDHAKLREVVVANMEGERGHSDLWLDFAEGMGASRNLQGDQPIPAMQDVVKHFENVAAQGTPEQALAAFYAYESQVPQVAAEKAHWLKEKYAADEKACGYFTLHAVADVYHSAAWREQLMDRVAARPESAEAALDAAETAAKMLWRALDGMESVRAAN